MELAVAGVVVRHHGAVAGHVVGADEGPSALRTLVLAADVKQVAVGDDGVAWGNNNNNNNKAMEDNGVGPKT